MILDLYRSASPEMREAGRAWYPNAYAICEAIGGGVVPAETVARVMAILSPRCTWRTCVAWTLLLVDAYLTGQPVPAVSTAGNRDKAWRELHGQPALSGQKVTAFARAIQGDPDAVVIDSWTMRSVGLSIHKTVTRARQRRITAAYTQAAAVVGESPRDLQAIVWCAIRGGAA